MPTAPAEAKRPAKISGKNAGVSPPPHVVMWQFTDLAGSHAAVLTDAKGSQVASVQGAYSISAAAR